MKDEECIYEDEMFKIYPKRIEFDALGGEKAVIEMPEETAITKAEVNMIKTIVLGTRAGIRKYWYDEGIYFGADKIRRDLKYILEIR